MARAATPAPERVWRAPRWSGPMTYYALGLAFGLAALAASPFLLSSSDVARSGSGLLWGLVGVALTVTMLGLILVPARRVERHADGSFRFVAWRRSLEVGRGELLSIRSVVPDPSRLWPMRVTALRGRIMLAPRIEGIGELCALLREASPHAGITDPDPWSGRFVRSEDIEPPAE